MDVMENPERSRFRLFEDETLENEKRLAQAWKKGGKEAVRQELEKMHPKMAEATKSANGPNASGSNSSPENPDKAPER